MKGIERYDIILPESLIKQLKDQIRNDVSNEVRVSNVNRNTTNSETYEPDIWGDTSYEFLFDTVNNIVNPENKYKRLSSWVMRYTDGQCTKKHHHNNFEFVAVYYISAPEGSGSLCFPDMDLEIKPYTGLLVAHKGDLVHSVKPNTKSGIERFCAVLNYR